MMSSNCGSAFGRTVLVLLLALWSASSTSAADLPPIKTIGIVSTLGDTLHHVYIGSTAFTNADSSEQVAEWKIDAFIVAEFTAQLSGRYEVRPVPVSSNDCSFQEQGGLFGRSGIDAEKCIASVRHADGSGPDAYIVVSNWSNDDFVMQTNQHLLGPGLYRRHGLFGDNLDALFVSAGVDLVDGRSSKKLDGLIFMNPGGEMFFSGGHPVQQQIKDAWDDHFIMLPEQRQRVEESFKAMLRDAVGLTVRRLDLVPKS